MRIDVLTLFPGLIEGAFRESMLGKAQENRLVQIRCHDLRRWALGRHHVTDEPPYGGGAGMVMKIEPIARALDELRTDETHVILMGPAGRRFNQEHAGRLANRAHLIFVCGHYEGVDHRVAEHLVDEEISIGDYILTNGAIAAAAVIDAVCRLVPGVLGSGDSATEESFSHDLLEYPQYTRPAEFAGWRVPDILLSGNHEAIRQWRMEQALKMTRERRPDLLGGGERM
ncbi:MAG: tRNA (guanosine(37)-N1)-methyltransferase TrmD [Verrucomicrobia bacterium]|nr:tRNA (guanosine(37)-N1)-methyltransferase TrmD [Verrucomicrobiota bacterium]